jgi:hypothetical protein
MDAATEMVTGPIKPDVPTKKPHAPMQPLQNAGEEEHFRLKLAGGRTARVLFQGDPPTQAEIKKLIANMELMLDQYPEH